MQQLVSIILPAYNAQVFLEETIQSVLSQTYPYWELIIVNDGSTDETTNIINTFASADKRIIPVHKPNSGVSDSRNSGRKYAKGELFFFLDSDDVWNPDNIEKKVKFLQSPLYDAVFSACLIINEKSETKNRFLKGSSNFTLNDLLLAKGNYTTAPSGIAVKKSVFNSISGFDVNLSNNADTDFFMQLLSVGKKIGYTNEVLWKYRVHEGNMSKNVTLLEKDILYLYRKAEKNNLFESIAFKRKCFSNIYMVLAGSWWHDGKNKIKGIVYVIRAFLCYPPILRKLLTKF